MICAAACVKPCEQRVEAGGQEVAAEAAGDAGERRRDARQRVAAGRVEDHAAERDHQHVARVGRRVADDRDQEQHRREQPAPA